MKKSMKITIYLVIPSLAAVPILKEIGMFLYTFLKR
jgi:hypothetical protein